jgi:hypothetical protein
MKEREVTSKLLIKHFVLTERLTKKLLSEADIIAHLKSQGFTVFKDYAFYFRNRIDNAYPTASRSQQSKLVKLAPTFHQSIFNLFTKHETGEPDFLVCKNNRWFFVEVKTSTDHLRYNQLVFLEELSQLIDTRLYYYTDLTSIPKINISKGNTKNNTGLDSRFVNFTKRLKSTQVKHDYKVYWVINKTLIKFPKLLFTNKSYRVYLSQVCNLELSKLDWYIENNYKRVFEEELNTLEKDSNFNNTYYEIKELLGNVF